MVEGQLIANERPARIGGSRAENARRLIQKRCIFTRTTVGFS